MKKMLILFAMFITSCSLWAQNNIITYTAPTKLVETTSGFGLHTNAFGVAIISHTFSDGIGTITFSGDVTSIGERAFSSCSGLISIEIPSSVTSIGEYAFFGCSTLTSIDIPSSVTSIGVEAFADCSSLTSIVVEQGNAIYDSRNDCNAIIETASNALLFGCQNTVIPSSVTSIGDDAFEGCSNLKTMIIPEGVTSIGDGAFSSCYGLTSIEIPTSVTSIGSYAFYSCSGLTLITIPSSVTSIGSYAFYSCSGLTLITIPSSVTSIGEYAFFGCSTLTSIDIPSSVTSIGGHAFSTCFSLTTIDIPNSVTSIGDYAFYDCSDLKFVTIPNGVTSIGNWTFEGCSGLTSVTIPSSMASIGNGAFYDCSGLTSITCKANIPPSLGPLSVFENVPRNIPLYVPVASVPLYQAAEQWNEFDVQPLLVEIDPIAPNTTEMTWNPVDSASLYQIHLYTESTSAIALDTTLLINADSLNGGIMLQAGASVARRVKKIIQDDHGSIVIIIVDPTSGTSADNPYKVTVSTESGERISVHYDMTVYQGTEVIREDHGTFVLNDDQPDGIENILVPSLPTGIYDLYGRRYTVDQWSSLPAGVYVLREEDNKVEKMMKR